MNLGERGNRKISIDRYRRKLQARNVQENHMSAISIVALLISVTTKGQGLELESVKMSHTERELCK